MVTKKTVKKTVKKVAPKSTATKKTAAKKSAPMRSFRVYKDAQPFTTFRITRQTVYWAILLIFIILTQVWLLKIQMDITDLTDIILAE